MNDKIRQILAISLIFFIIICILEFFIYTVIKNEQWKHEEFSAKVIQEYMYKRVEFGLKLGLSFNGLSKIYMSLGFVEKKLNYYFAVLDDKKEKLFSTSLFPISVIDECRDHLSETSMILHSGDKILINRLTFQENRTAGYTIIYINHNKIESNINSVFISHLKHHLLFIALAYIVVFLIIVFVNEKKYLLMNYCVIGIAISAILLCGIVSIYKISDKYIENFNDNIKVSSTIIAREFNRLILSGFDLSKVNGVSNFLDKINECYNGRVTITLVEEKDLGMVSKKEEDKEVYLASHPYFLIGGGNASYCLLINIAKEPWLRDLRSIAFDTLTLTVIAVILLFEILLTFQRAESIVRGRNVPQSMMRLVVFACFFAEEMTLSFITLKMGELIPPDTPSYEFLMGLPLSVEMATAGLFLPIAGSLIRRLSPLQAFVNGLLLLAIGYGSPVLFVSPWWFIASRGIAGIGYCLCLLAAKVVTVQHNLLSDMYAGLYAGSICGVAIGGMLAERLGYNQVFLIAAAIFGLLALILFSCRFQSHAKRGSLIGILNTVFDADTPRAHKERQTLTWTKHILHRFLSLQSLVFVLGIIVPLTLIKSGMLEFVLPVMLKESCPQGDIGRIFMLNSLIVVLVAPPCSFLCNRFACYRLGVLCCLFLSVAAVLALVCFPLIPGAIALSVLLGLATALSIPATSEYLIRLPQLKNVDTSSSMTWLSIFERLGDVAGPVAIGASMTCVGLAMTSVGMCILFGASGAVFAVVSGLTKRKQ